MLSVEYGLLEDFLSQSCLHFSNRLLVTRLCWKQVVVPDSLGPVSDKAYASAPGEWDLVNVSTLLPHISHESQALPSVFGGVLAGERHVILSQWLSASVLC